MILVPLWQSIRDPDVLIILNPCSNFLGFAVVTKPHDSVSRASETPILNLIRELADGQSLHDFK